MWMPLVVWDLLALYATSCLLFFSQRYSCISCSLLAIYVCRYIYINHFANAEILDISGPRSLLMATLQSILSWTVPNCPRRRFAPWHRLQNLQMITDSLPLLPCFWDVPYDVIANSAIVRKSEELKLFECAFVMSLCDLCVILSRLLASRSFWQSGKLNRRSGWRQRTTYTHYDIRFW